MAGHSKWKQIKHYKAATDKKRGALFTKLIREITVAAKQGGGDPDGNPRLRTAIDAAKASSMPKDNIERAVKKGTGELEGVDYVEVMYEAFAPGGVALMIQALTDNATRTVADVRFTLSRGGIGEFVRPATVSWIVKDHRMFFAKRRETWLQPGAQRHEYGVGSASNDVEPQLAGSTVDHALGRTRRWSRNRSRRRRRNAGRNRRWRIGRRHVGPRARRQREDGDGAAVHRPSPISHLPSHFRGSTMSSKRSHCL
jgi:hypothetical protein